MRERVKFHKVCATSNGIIDDMPHVYLTTIQVPLNCLLSLFSLVPFSFFKFSVIRDGLLVVRDVIKNLNV